MRVYGMAACRIQLMDGKELDVVHGKDIKYVGPPMDLSEGEVDLKVWLRLMGRGAEFRGAEI